jgi:predicted glycoside hydrolase/deacetylase ChbG (UPF0249 family)
MKLIVRADDVGYTNVCNIGAFETMYNGVTTAADLMLDTPGAVDAMERLKEMPWISVGWHNHFWGSPVLDPSKVPTMYDPKTGHFRADLKFAEDVSYDECLAEMRAQMDRCVKVLGRAPDTILSFGGTTPFSLATTKIIEEYGIISGFAYSKPFFFQEGEDRGYHTPECYAERKIYMLQPGETTEKMVRTDSLEEHVTYNPLIDLFSGVLFAEIPDDATVVFVLHPGYVDHYVCREGDNGPGAPHYLIVRPIDSQALCSAEIKAWIRENKFELCSFTDALHGTQKYQNHLRAIDSDLCML